jgi:CrcB protein
MMPGVAAVALVMLGGATGSLARYIVQLEAQSWLGSFPAGTLLVNLVGCFAIGVLNTAFSGPLPIRPEYRAALVTGLLGGFTTFSAFGWETFQLADHGDNVRAAAYVAASVLLGLGAVWAGARLTERLYGL